MVITVAFLNLCLGFTNKKNLVKELLLNENVDILCIQETEISPELEVNHIIFRGLDTSPKQIQSKQEWVVS